MCTTCDHIRHNIALAQLRGNYTTVVEQTGLLQAHRANTCAEARVERERARLAVEWRTQVWVVRP